MTMTMTSRADRNSSDYHRIERAIRFLDDAAPVRPSLDQVARHVGMSPFHFQRPFKKHRGVTPQAHRRRALAERARRALGVAATVTDAVYLERNSVGAFV